MVLLLKDSLEPIGAVPDAMLESLHLAGDASVEKNEFRFL
jgi:hypothetical protein